MKEPLALIGPGRLGSALAHVLQKGGYPLTAVVGRTRETALAACRFIGCPASLAATRAQTALKARIILLTVPDARIAPLSRVLQKQPGWRPDTLLIHCSGLLPAAIMRHPPASVRALSVHPLLPFADSAAAVRQLPGCPCALEGDAAALPVGRALIETWGGRTFQIPTAAKSLYHTAAALASNYLVTLLAQARDLLCEQGIPQDQALELFRPLVHATLDNINRLGPEEALTGPIVRGDAQTVTAHLDALAERDDIGLLQLYRQLGELTVSLATRSGRLSSADAAKFSGLLNLQPHDSPPHEQETSEKNN